MKLALIVILIMFLAAVVLVIAAGIAMWIAEKIFSGAKYSIINSIAELLLYLFLVALQMSVLVLIFG